MANSSDWLARVGDGAPARPAWMAALEDSEGFCEGAPFALAEASPPVPAVSETPPADPAEDALARAYAEGEAAGRAAAEAEAAAAAAQHRALRLSFRTLDEAARGVLADDLAATVMALCDKVLADCAPDPAALRARCEAAARRIGGAAEALTLHLHPQDLAALEADTLGPWRVAVDADMERGSLRIEGPDGAISDGPAEWRRAIAAAVRG